LTAAFIQSEGVLLDSSPLGEATASRQPELRAEDFQTMI
jgi:hypothetical protein